MILHEYIIIQVLEKFRKTYTMPACRLSKFNNQIYTDVKHL